MMVVQPGESNIFDQIWIEQQLFTMFVLVVEMVKLTLHLCSRYKVKLVRKSLAEINAQARLVGEKKELYMYVVHHGLFLTLASFTILLEESL